MNTTPLALTYGHLIYPFTVDRARLETTTYQFLRSKFLIVPTSLEERIRGVFN